MPPPADDAARGGSGRRGRIALVVALGLTGLILWLLIDRLASVGDFWGALRAAAWEWVALAAALVLVNVGLAAWRLAIAIGSLGVQLRWSRALDTVLATWPLALLTPSRAGDAARAVALRDLLPIPEGVSAVLAEKLVDVQSLCLLAAVGGATSGLWSVFGLALAALIGEWTVAGLFVANAHRLQRWPVTRKLGDKPQRLVAGVKALMRQPRRFAGLSLVSLVSFVEACVIAFVLLTAVGADVPFAAVMALWPVALFAGLLPITIGGVGTRDGAFLGLLALAGVDAPQGAVLAATVLYAVVATVLPAVIGVVPMLRHARQLAAGGGPQATTGD